MSIILLFMFMSLAACEQGHQKQTEAPALEVHKHEEREEKHEPDEHGHSDHLEVNPSILDHMGIRSSLLQGTAPWKVPLGTSVSSGRDVFVYHQEKKGSFSKVHVRVSQSDQKHEWLESKDLKPEDEIITEGAKFLRVIELDAAAGDEAGHAH